MSHTNKAEMINWESTQREPTTCICKAGLTLGDFFVRRRLFRGRAIFNGRAIMSSCVHIRRFNSRESPTIFMLKLVHHNHNVIYK